MEQVTGYLVYGKFHSNEKAAIEEKARLDETIEFFAQKIRKVRDIVATFGEESGGSLRGMTLSMDTNFIYAKSDELKWWTEAFFTVMHEMNGTVLPAEEMNEGSRVKFTFSNGPVSDERIHEALVYRLTEERTR